MLDQNFCPVTPSESSHAHWVNTKLGLTRAAIFGKINFSIWTVVRSTRRQARESWVNAPAWRLSCCLCADKTAVDTLQTPALFAASRKTGLVFLVAVLAACEEPSHERQRIQSQTNPSQDL